MAEQAPVTLSGLVLNDETTIGLGELCRAAGISADALLDMVAEGLLEPVGGPSPAQWRFAARTLTQVQVAVRLQRDLQVNLSGAALALDLLEEVRRLRAQVQALERQLHGGSD